jgi:cytochrome c peroxidase
MFKVRGTTAMATTLHKHTFPGTTSYVVLTFFLFFAGGASLALASLESPKKEDFVLPQKVPVPEDNELTPARIQLGKMLFFDPRLSGSNWISCATCHNPGLGWSDGLPKAIGDGQRELKRATPTIINAAYNKVQMWDGRFRTLEEQAMGPIGASVEMNQNPVELVKELASIGGYVKLFNDAYPNEGITSDTIRKAIASFERTITTKDSPFDRWAKGDKSAISKDAKAGFKLFVGKARCVKCHNGYNFTDDGFHNIGLKDNSDEGRYALRKVKILKGAFKTPTLRNVEFTAPYMHNGEYQTLEQVVEHYAKGGIVKTHLSPNMKPLDLTKNEKRQLVIFMKALSSKPINVSVPRLPQ